MPASVHLNLYDLNAPINKGLRPLGTGAFHGGVEVYGQEWSYGFAYKGTGVFSCKPRECDGPDFREAVGMGETKLSEEEVLALLEDLKSNWAGEDYDLLRNNCVIFSNVLCERLGVKPVPKWVTNLAGAGATIANGIEVSTSAARRAAIVAAAKAGQIDDKYKIRGTAEAKGRDFLEAVKAADGKYNFAETATALTSKAAGVAGGAAGKAAGVAGGVAGKAADVAGGVVGKAAGVAGKAADIASKASRASSAAVASSSAGRVPSAQQQPQLEGAEAKKDAGCLCC